MAKLFIKLLIIFGVSNWAYAQHLPAKFGKGLQFSGQDSSFYIKIGLRFQNLIENQWDLREDDLGQLENHESAILVRRSRLKFDGYAYSPKLKFKFELGLSNRDISSGNQPEFRSTANVILDAYVRWNFYKNFSIQFGQGKLPGNRERVISSGNLQFVDRSRLNSRFNIDRDMGIQLMHHFKLGERAILKETLSISQGEGRNVTAGHFGGYDYTFRLEALPFGNFQSKGDYVGSAIKKEDKLKMAIGVTYDINKNAVRERGNLGSFIKDETNTYYGTDLTTFFVDAMIKYKGLSVMAEYVHKNTAEGNGRVFSEADELIGTYYIGDALNLQVGYMFDNNWEVALRYTDINPDIATPETQYTLGISKFIVGHKLKVQTDVTYRKIDFNSDNLIWRTQMDIHF